MLRSGANVVLSHEGFFGSPLMSPFEPWFNRAPEVASEMQDFFCRVAEVRLVLFLRPQTAWLESLYAQWCRWSGLTSPVDSTAFANSALKSPFVNYLSLLQAIQESAPGLELDVRIHSHESVNEFLRALSTDGPAPNPGLRANEGPPKSQIAMLHKIARFAGIDDAFAASQLFSKFPLVSQSDDNSSFFSSQIQEELRRREAKDWSELAESAYFTSASDTVLARRIASEARGALPRDHFGEFLASSTDAEALHLLQHLLHRLKSRPGNVTLGWIRKVRRLSRRAVGLRSGRG